MLVVNKPSGLVVHPAPGHASGTLVNAAQALVNRGRDITSTLGIIVRSQRRFGLLVARERDLDHVLQHIVQGF